jgi:hypothetical protein
VEGDAVGPHIAGIFERNPDLQFTGRRLYARDGLVVSAWTATATNRAGQRIEWDGIDVINCRDGLISLRIHKTLTLPQAWLAYAAFCVFMVGCSIAKDRRRSPAAFELIGRPIGPTASS